MTAETDAMRLVPITDAMRDAFYEATTVTREGTILNFDDGLRAAFAAAPAVQPAAAVALSASDRACYDYPGVDQVKERAAFVAGAEYAALAHPPAQGSESGGEDREAVRWIRKASREITGGNCAFVDDDLALLAHLAKRAVDAGLTDDLSPQVQAALSQPGPVSHLSAIAAPVSPVSDLLKEAVGVLKSWVASAEAEHVEGLFFDDVRDTRAFLSKVEERGHD